MRIEIGPFGGMIPSVDDQWLPNEAAKYAENCDMHSGAADGLVVPTLYHTLVNGSSGKVFRLPDSYDRSSYVPDSFWMEFASANTDVVRSPVVDDVYDRYYWASDGDVPRYNTRSRIESSADSYLLGIPQPGAITVTPSGGVGPVVSRAYIITWVSQFGEEGPPSEAYLVSGNADGTWTVAFPSVASDDIDGPDRDLDRVRVYRTVTGDTGVELYYYVGDAAIGATNYVDSAADTAVIGNGPISSLSLYPPPDDIEGFAMMPNGIVAGFRENEVWFCEPYKPHAWPPGYVKTVEYPVIGLAVVGQTLVVCTAGNPVTMTGTHPSFMAEAKLSNQEPCVSRGSIISAPEGVYYSSTNGLVLVNPGRAQNITKNLVDRRDWQRLTKLTALRAAMYGSAYYAYGTATVGIFQADAFDANGVSQDDTLGSKTGIIIHPDNDRIAFSMLKSDIDITNVFNDVWSSETFTIKDGKVYGINQTLDDVVIDPYIWRSKVFQLPRPGNLGACKVFFETTTTTPDLPAEAPWDLNQTLDDKWGVLRIYANKVLVYSRELRESGMMFRLPAGLKKEYWQIEVEARVRVTRIHVASTVKELRNAPSG